MSFEDCEWFILVLPAEMYLKAEAPLNDLFMFLLCFCLPVPLPFTVSQRVLSGRLSVNNSYNKAVNGRSSLHQNDRR